MNSLTWFRCHSFVLLEEKSSLNSVRKYWPTSSLPARPSICREEQVFSLKIPISRHGVFVWISLMGPVVKNPPANSEDIRDTGSIPRFGRSPGGGHGNPLQYSCLENPHGQRSLVAYSPPGRKESDTTEQLSTAQIAKESPVFPNRYY